jgi:hypothetical protein
MPTRNNWLSHVQALVTAIHTPSVVVRACDSPTRGQEAEHETWHLYQCLLLLVLQRKQFPVCLVDMQPCLDLFGLL